MTLIDTTVVPRPVSTAPLIQQLPRDHATDALTKYETACRAIAEATSVDVVNRLLMVQRGNTCL
ncbi:MAG TPA: hypothetical protein VNZ53_60295 [Steroidobacteraceae bacterium]|jgi:hypothetical protein|nr:hypothetical protein [Steroidobacteraceae bacterium]